jgi:hypothetical protein
MIVDTFIVLNGIRILSIVAIILVFASNIVTLVHDVQAVNRFVSAGKNDSTQTNNSTVTVVDYIS